MSLSGLNLIGKLVEITFSEEKNHPPEDDKRGRCISIEGPFIEVEYGLTSKVSSGHIHWWEHRKREDGDFSGVKREIFNTANTNFRSVKVLNEKEPGK